MQAELANCVLHPLEKELLRPKQVVLNTRIYCLLLVLRVPIICPACFKRRSCDPRPSALVRRRVDRVECWFLEPGHKRTTLWFSGTQKSFVTFVFRSLAVSVMSLFLKFSRRFNGRGRSSCWQRCATWIGRSSGGFALVQSLHHVLRQAIRTKAPLGPKTTALIPPVLRPRRRAGAAEPDHGHAVGCGVRGAAASCVSFAVCGNTPVRRFVRGA